MIYEYECTECDNVQEEIHGMNDNPEIKCKKCEAKMSKIISGGSGFMFKGGSPSGDARFKKSMKQKNEKMRKKMHDHVKPVENMRDLSSS